ncbi:MAG: hypothetical protein H7Y03_05140 [Chitinophagaceae bacterium]|nr:hypothetical protein [Chitinophagaceae bacterium]
MKQTLTLLPFLILLACCRHNTPDVSNIPVDIKIERFDEFVFRKMDTSNMGASIRQMQAAYPYFGEDFLVYFLGLSPLSGLQGQQQDSSEATIPEFKRFIRSTKPVYDSIEPKFRDLSQLEKDLKKAFQFVKYYFPSYKLPKLIAYAGPFDAPGVAVTPEAMAIGLQLYAGKNFPFYTSTQGQEVFPLYISRRFEPQYITPNCMKAVIEDLYPENSAGKSLIEQMIENGKRWYLLNKLLPETADSLITGYTQRQLDWIDDNEALVWNFILQGTDIYTTDPSSIKTYIGEAPTTTGMPELSPGNIGQWLGLQIVKAYAEKHTDISPDALMKLEARRIFLEAKYKPR